jgi:hypothetical protein
MQCVFCCVSPATVRREDVEFGLVDLCEECAVKRDRSLLLDPSTALNIVKQVVTTDE